MSVRSEKILDVLEPVTTSPASVALASRLASDSARREIPVRQAFVRSEKEGDVPPLAQLIRLGGRGGGVAIKLYLALIWRSSAEPFSSDLSARQWATLLDLPQPATLGARRIANALRSLENLRLIEIEARQGRAPLVQLLDESGSGRPYALPSTAYTKASGDKARQRNLYFKVPLKLWTTGEVQAMSAPALAMLLVLLCESRGRAREVWWSTDLFPKRFNLSPSVRSRGTAELKRRRLVSVRKELVDRSGGSAFVSERVRNKYLVCGAAETLAVREARFAKKGLKVRLKL